MLILSRRSGERILLYPDYSKLSPDITIGELFGADGCITISVTEIVRGTAKIGIDAIKEISVVRQELEENFNT